MKKKIRNPKNTRTVDMYPDKAYDPMKLFRQHLDDANDKNGPRTLQTEDDVINSEYKFPVKSKKDKYSHIKKYLRTMNMKK